MPLVSVLLSVLMVSAVQVEAQTPKRETAPAELTRTITSLDSALFDSYNRCDLEKFATFWSDDVEFYHDQSGLMVGAQNLTEAIRKNICGKVRRDLVPGTLEVYVMHGYGAMEMGVHRFHHPGRDDVEPVGEAKFIQLWQNTNGRWRVTRVVSYDHHPLPR
jgi:ketosteroid isomerase-like protein